VNKPSQEIRAPINFGRQKNSNASISLRRKENLELGPSASAGYAPSGPDNQLVSDLMEGLAHQVFPYF
jgi:hypothetical protein